MSSSLKPLSNFNQISHGAFVERVLRIYLNGFVPLNKMAAMHIMVETLRNLLLQNQERFEDECCYIAWGTQGLPSLSNNGLKLTFDLLKATSNVRPVYKYGENV